MRLVVTIAGLAAMAGTPAMAATVVERASFDSSTGASIARFDSTLGTLRSVQIDLVALLGGDYMFFGFDGATLRSVAVSGDYQFEIPGLSTSFRIDETVIPTNPGQTFGTAMAQISRSWTLTGAQAADWLGSGTVWATGGGPASLRGNVDGDGFFEAGNRGMSGGDITVTYDYAEAGLTRTSLSPVPEPAAWLLMIAGFGLVGYVLRQRRRRGAVLI